MEDPYKDNRDVGSVKVQEESMDTSYNSGLRVSTQELQEDIRHIREGSILARSVHDERDVPELAAQTQGQGPKAYAS